jgi:hypothetical protein
MFCKSNVPSPTSKLFLHQNPTSDVSFETRFCERNAVFFHAGRAFDHRECKFDELLPTFRLHNFVGYFTLRSAARLHSVKVAVVWSRYYPDICWRGPRKPRTPSARRAGVLLQIRTEPLRIRVYGVTATQIPLRFSQTIWEVPFLVQAG